MSDFQARCARWATECFGETVAKDIVERNHRFLEEALELVQANGSTREEAHKLVDYVFDRPAGDPKQELGGVMMTLAVLSAAYGISMEAWGNVELNRCWKNFDKIRAKHLAKRERELSLRETSPLP